MDKEELFYILLNRELDDNKKNILKFLSKQEKPVTGVIIGKKFKLSPPLVTYHLNGYIKPDSPGLIELGLVERYLDERKLSKGFIITELGREILEKLK